MAIKQLKRENGKSIDRKTRQLEQTLIPFFKDRPLSQISTFNRHLNVLSHMMNKAHEWGWIKHKPCVIKKFKENNFRTEYLTSEQIHRLLEEAKKDDYPILYPFIRIALGTSMRLREILSIRLEDIDFNRHMIYIPKAKTGAREQPMTKELSEYLEGYIRMVSPDQPWLFPSKMSKSGHYEAIERPFRRVVAAAGMDPYKVIRHTLRHTAITHLVQAGVDLPTVMRISGHKSLQMVQRYSHQNGAHIEAAMEKLEKKYIIYPEISG